MSNRVACFVIGLPSDHRGIELMTQLTTLGLPPTAVDGVRVSDLSAREFEDVVFQSAAKLVLGGQLTDGEIGCALAHRKVYESHMAGESEWALVFEDDARLLDAEALVQLIASLQNDEYVSGKPTIIQLYSERVVLDGSRDQVWPSRVKRSLTTPFTTTAYLINRSASVAMEGATRPVTNPADWPARIERRVSHFVAVPHIAVPAPGPSVVGERDRAQGPAGRWRRKWIGVSFLLWLKGRGLLVRPYRSLHVYIQREIIDFAVPRLTSGYRYSTGVGESPASAPIWLRMLVRPMNRRV